MGNYRRMPMIWLGCLSLLLVAPAVAENAPGVGTAALIEAENKVTVKRAGTKTWEKGVPPRSLALGDVVQTGFASRAALRLTDASVLRINELARVEIVPPLKESAKAGIDISAGAAYFFSREKPNSLEVRTPSVNGALRGTEFVVRVAADGGTVLTMLDGEVELSNAQGSVVVRSGEEGAAAIGQAPHKTAVLETRRLVQWALYYPGVVDPRELGLGADAKGLEPSRAAYNAGDLLGALELYPLSEGGGSSAAERVYRAAVLLSVGRVDAAEAALQSVPEGTPGRGALERMIAVVTLAADPGAGAGGPKSAGDWVADSYAWQGSGDLEKARDSARRATVAGPDFGFAWVRLAQMEFSFGRTPEAEAALEKGLALSPRNAAGFALKGFLLSADNKISEARAAFDTAIQIDGALGQAWLGRGLTFIREGRDAEGRRDLQTAATLEPNRSILRSYLGKAFSAVGEVTEARKELKRAQQLDPKDPTPLLYSAIEAKQENRYNEAVRDLEESVALNDNRRVYRSQFLLDEDLSVRGTNLAAIYLNDGMPEQSVREAVRAVDDDYGNAAAHLFLANSYNALRDPDRVLLRYETPWFNELLLSNLLSPVGGGPLSQFVSEQEYSKMFQKDGFGASSTTDYFSSGAYEETASQYGTFGNFSYALDTQYQEDNGTRTNNGITRWESYVQLKFQLTPQDTLFFQTKFEDLSTGDLRQVYDPDSLGSSLESQTFHMHESDDPGLVLLGYHHEWSPGQHTLLLVGRVASHQAVSALGTNQTLVVRDVSALPLPPGNPMIGDPGVNQVLEGLAGQGPIKGVSATGTDFDYSSDFVAYTAELQQIATIAEHTLVAGARYQNGSYDTSAQQVPEPNPPATYVDPGQVQNEDVGLERINVYLYDTWQAAPWLSLTGGVTYDRLIYPDNFRNPPIDGERDSLEKVSPKAGFILQPLPGTVVRGAWGQAISGAGFDESVRLEPTQVAGFTQAFRSLASESILGELAGSRYTLWGLSLEQKLATQTYLGLEYTNLEQQVGRTVGVFEREFSSGIIPGDSIVPSSISATDLYREQNYIATVNQLLGDEWSLALRYKYTTSSYDHEVPDFQSAAAALPPASPGVPNLESNGKMFQESSLNTVTLGAFYNHPSGFFATADADWYLQSNLLGSDPQSEFWQFNTEAGFRFDRNQCSISAGVLNWTDQDYKLSPLNPVLELPRARTLVVRARFSF